MSTPHLLFEGLAILCFYTNGLFQGHFIDKENNKSPYSLAGQHLTHYIDPQHNDCMEPDDFYRVLIQPHFKPEKISLLLRRPKDNDAGGLFSHDHEEKENNGYQFQFETHQFMNGEKALDLKSKYFNSKEHDVVICVGDVKLEKIDLLVGHT